MIASLFQPIPIAQAEPRLQISKAQGVLASMTPEEKVGQLFLVTFQGTDTHDQTHIYDLIANQHVGGKDKRERLIRCSVQVLNGKF